MFCSISVACIALHSTLICILVSTLQIKKWPCLIYCSSIGLGDCVHKNENRTPLTEVMQNTFVLDSAAKSTQVKQHTHTPPTLLRKIKTAITEQTTGTNPRLQTHILNADVL